MPTTRAISAATTEPVSLSLLKAHLRLDLAAGAEDELLAQYIGAARGKAEKYCNQYFTNRVLETTFTVTEPYQLPAGAGPVTAVRGFITDLSQLPTVERYWQEYVKGIVVSRDYPINYDNLPTYTVTYDLDATPEPEVVVAILKIAADLYENRENSVTGVLNRHLAIGFQALLNPYRIID